MVLVRVVVLVGGTLFETRGDGVVEGLGGCVLVRKGDAVFETVCVVLREEDILLL